MKLLAYAPVLRREWIVERYLDHLAASAARADVELEILLVGGLGDPTFDIVDSLPRHVVTKMFIDEDRDIDQRGWTTQRLERMVEVRNKCLAMVRQLAPDLALSCDSDVLLHPDAIGNLVETQRGHGWGVVGGYCYMTPTGRAYPSYGLMPSETVLQRPDIVGQVKRIDVPMAIVLMTPAAYSVDYAYHRKGEDIGIALAWRAAGVTCGIDARVVNRHIMEQAFLDRDDPRVS